MNRDISASKAAARLARRWLAKAAKAAGQFQGAEPGRALHDWRTSMRRLRVVLSAYRDHLGPAASRAMRRRLRRLSRMTGKARDAQVWAVWLKKYAARDEGACKVGAHLEAVAGRCLEDFIRQGLPEFQAAAEDIFTSLGKVKPSRVVYRRALSKAVRAAAKRLDRSLKPVRQEGSPAQMHAARIKIKHLRYILEPLAPSDLGVRKLVGRLRELQGIFGQLHDLHELAACGVPAAVEPAQLAASRLERQLWSKWLRPRRDKRLIKACQHSCLGPA